MLFGKQLRNEGLFGICLAALLETCEVVAELVSLEVCKESICYTRRPSVLCRADLCVNYFPIFHSRKSQESKGMRKERLFYDFETHNKRTTVQTRFTRQNSASSTFQLPYTDFFNMKVVIRKSRLIFSSPM